MSKIPSQVIASWVTKHVSSVDWLPLISLVSKAIQQEAGLSADQADELTDENLEFIKDHLQNELEQHRAAGTPANYELDEEQLPYIRSLLDKDLMQTLATLRKIEPREFEKICAEILRKFGANVRVEGGSDDGGIDFIGDDILLHPSAKVIPFKSRLVVIGQAKRFKKNNLVKLSEVRQFVGACKAKIHELKRNGKVGPFSPVVCAFWTTSGFDLPATEYAAKMGLWYLDGVSIARYVRELGVQFPITLDIPQDVSKDA